MSLHDPLALYLVGSRKDVGVGAPFWARPWVKKFLLCVGFSVLTALVAQLSVTLPFSPVPITGQTFGVLLTGFALGSRLGFWSMGLYLLQGACGLPVFAGGASGIWVFAGASGGYLLSYPFAAAAVGLCAERGWDRHLPKAALAMLFGEAIIYLFGLPQLASWLALAGHPADLYAVLWAGLLPFIPGDFLKACLVAVLLPSVWRLMPKHAGRK